MTSFLAGPHIANSCKRTISNAIVDLEQEQAADELLAIGEDRRASRVRQCGSFAPRRCHDRRCPKCSAKTSSRNRDLALMAIGRFSHPFFMTLTLPSRGPWALGDALREFGKARLQWQRRTVVTRLLAGGVGGLEPHLDRRQVLWAVHAHFVVDARSPVLDLDALRDAWGEVTAGRGRLLEPSGGAALKAPARAASYVTKRDDWSPPVGSLPPRALLMLTSNMKGRRVFIAWGTGRNR